MRRLTVTLLTLTVLGWLLVPPGTASAASIEEVTWFGSNPGALRMYRYVPDGLPAGRPVVVALHGCTQNGPGYGSSSGWVTLAQRWQFSVVMPEQQQINNSNRCFNWFSTSDTTRGFGEAESIAQMVRRMVSDTAADTSRIHVTGLSAGGAMTAVMLATYPELFAGGAVVAGIPYRCASSLYEAFSCMSPGRDLTPAQWGDRVRAASWHRGPWPTMSVWHGTADYTVAVANQRELVDQWTNVHGIGTTPSGTDTVAGYPHAYYRNGAGRTVVETYTITGMAHGQPVDPGTGPAQCGTTGPYFLDVNVCAAHTLSTAWQLTA